MKKIYIKKALFILISLTVIIAYCGTSIYATLGSGFDSNNIPDGTLDSGIKGVGDRIRGILVIVFQFLSVFGIVFAGIKYMYSSSDKRAEIKKGLIGISIGCIIVFGASTVIGLVTDVFNEFYMKSIF